METAAIMASMKFTEFEAVIRAAVNPAIKQQFNNSNNLYNQFAKGGYTINARGYRIPYFGTNPHPWQEEAGPGLQAYTRLLRGELQLPHAPEECGDCREAFGWQIELLRGRMRGLGQRGPVSLSSRRNEIAMALRDRATQGEQQ